MISHARCKKLLEDHVSSLRCRYNVVSPIGKFGREVRTAAMQAGILEDIVSHTVILHFAARSNDEAIERELITIVTAWSDWSAVETYQFALTSLGVRGSP